jgi:hypothetical protein
MQWIVPPEKDTATDILEQRLWDAAGQFHANSGPRSDIPHSGNVTCCHDDPHDATRRRHFVLANSPFNSNAVDKVWPRASAFAVKPRNAFP